MEVDVYATHSNSFWGIQGEGYSKLELIEFPFPFVNLSFFSTTLMGD